MIYLIQVLLYDITKETKYKTAAEGFVSSYMPGGSVTYTPCGLAWRLEWGSLRYSGNGKSKEVDDFLVTIRYTCNTYSLIFSPSFLVGLH